MQQSAGDLPTTCHHGRSFTGVWSSQGCSPSQSGLAITSSARAPLGPSPLMPSPLDASPAPLLSPLSGLICQSCTHIRGSGRRRDCQQQGSWMPWSGCCCLQAEHTLGIKALKARFVENAFCAFLDMEVPTGSLGPEGLDVAPKAAVTGEGAGGGAAGGGRPGIFDDCPICSDKAVPYGEPIGRADMKLFYTVSSRSVCHHLLTLRIRTLLMICLPRTRVLP